MGDEYFFVVWNRAHGVPTVTHATYEIAEREAKRLASLNPGDEFFILQALAVAKRAEPVTVTKLDMVPF